jgi:hypothetical protein
MDLLLTARAMTLAMSSAVEPRRASGPSGRWRRTRRPRTCPPRTGRAPRRQRMPGSTSRVSRTRPKKLVSNWRRIPSIGCCSTGPYSQYPALLISTPGGRVCLEPSLVQSDGGRPADSRRAAGDERYFRLCRGGHGLPLRNVHSNQIAICGASRVAQSLAGPWAAFGRPGTPPVAVCRPVGPRLLLRVDAHHPPTVAGQGGQQTADAAANLRVVNWIDVLAPAEPRSSF